MFISDFAIRRPIITVVTMIALVVFGLASLSRLDTDEFPAIDHGSVGRGEISIAACMEKAQERYRQVRSGAWNAPDPGEAIRRITSTAGMAIGIVTAVLLVAFVVHRRKGN